MREGEWDRYRTEREIPLIFSEWKQTVDIEALFVEFAPHTFINWVGFRF